MQNRVDVMWEMSGGFGGGVTVVLKCGSSKGGVTALERCAN